MSQKSRYSRDFLDKEIGRLLFRAALTVAAWGMLGALVGPFAAVTIAKSSWDDSGLLLVGAAIGTLLGAAIGEVRARSLRLQAHTLAVQVEIERHLAELVEASRRPVPVPPPVRLG